MCTSASKLDSGTLAAVHQEFAIISPALHRIRTVRRQQGINLRGLSRRTGERVYDLEREELPGNDLTLSRLYWWEHWLEVPVSELLVEPDAGLSPRILERARLIRIMKTVAAIKEAVKGEVGQRLAERLEGQLLEVMPELSGVLAWNTVGQRRTLDELGRVEERSVSVRDLIGE